MGDVVDLREWKDRKQGKKREESGVVQAMRDSLDNNKVKQNYKIKEPTHEERQARIKESMERINKLMSDLEKSK